jgi:hypothetical protein
MDYDAGGMSSPGEEDLSRIIAQFASHGLTASTGG